MRTSTSRGHRCICQATIQLAETGLFRESQYLTVPLHLFPDSEDLGRGAIDTILIHAPAEQERNRKAQ